MNKRLIKVYLIKIDMTILIVFLFVNWYPWEISKFFPIKLDFNSKAKAALNIFRLTPFHNVPQLPSYFL